MFNAEAAGEIPEGTANAMLLTLIRGGMDTTVSGLGTAMRLLADHPDVWEAMKTDPDLAVAVFEESLRLESPVQGNSRTSAPHPVEIEGFTIPPETKVLLLHAAANRDPDKFEDPDRIVLDRSPNNHAGFGLGAHHCVGSFLARLEIRIMLEELLGRYASLRLDPHQPVKLSSGGNQGITALPLILG